MNDLPRARNLRSGSTDAQPLLREWYRERLSPRAVAKEWRRQAPELIEALRAAPMLRE